MNRHQTSDIRHEERGQASLEMTVALIGMLLLLLGSLKVFVWMNERLVARQRSYENTRVSGGRWVEPSKPLDIFKHD